MKKIIVFLLAIILLIVIFVKVDIFEEENINFIKTGNVVMNNPGMEEGIWYLIYEEPGSPAQIIELFFEEEKNINIGDRLTIEGVLEGDRVIVKRIVDNSIDF